MTQKAIVNGRLIDGTGSDPIEPGVVLVDAEEIVGAGQADAIEIPAEAERIDAAGKTVMPGLIDAHMHVGFHFAALKRLRDSLNRGVTTVAAVTGGPGAVLLRKAIEQGQVDRCSRYWVGAVVGATGGHLHRTDGNVAGVTADGPWEVRRGVREMITAGVDFINASASGGFQWEHERVSWEDYTLDELTALAEEAHSKGKRVGVHAHSQPGLNHAIQAGCDIIYHGALIDDEALEGIKARNLWYMPTLYITSRESIDRPSLPAHTRERMEHAHPIHREGVRKAHQMGIRISVGTDGGPGSVMVELEELVACGLSPMEALVAATRNTAEAYGLQETLGTLEPGKKADLLIVRGDPLADIHLLCDQENLMLIMKDGLVQMTDESFRAYLPTRP